jgi:hypothetical protein
MKRFLILAFALISFLAVSTSYSMPTFGYSAVAYNNLGQIITGPAIIAVNVTIISGPAVYTDNFPAVPVNPFGVFSFTVGSTNPPGFALIPMLSSSQIFVKINNGGPWITVVGAPLAQEYYKTHSSMVGAESDPVFSGSPAGTITAPMITNWNNAVLTTGSYGNPSWLTSLAWSKITGAPAFITTELDPVYSASSWFSTTNNSANWNTAFGWGNHAGLYAPIAHVGSNGTSHALATGALAGFMSAADFTKLSGIAAGAEVNVNADWAAVAGDAQILNKPTTLAGYGITDAVQSNPALVSGTNTKITYDTKGLVTAGATAQLASTDFANQGTTITVLHGNAAGAPSWGLINLGTDVTGTLPAGSFPGLTGDVTSPSGSYVTTLSNSGVTAATYGSATQVGQFAVDAKGRITSASNVAIAIPQSAVTNLTTDLNAKANLSGATFTGAISATNLSGTNTGNVTLAGENYLSLAGQVITANPVNLANTNVTGTLPVANGGTGQSAALVAGGVLYGASTTAAAVTAAGTAGQVLTSNGAGTPTWTTLGGGGGALGYGELYYYSDAGATLSITTEDVWFRIDNANLGTTLTTGLTSGTTLNNTNGTITVGSAGIWEVNYSISLYNQANNDIFIVSVFVDGVEQQKLGSRFAKGSNSNIWGISNSALINLPNGNEVVDIRIQNTSGTTDIDIYRINFHVNKF